MFYNHNRVNQNAELAREVGIVCFSAFIQNIIDIYILLKEHKNKKASQKVEDIIIDYADCISFKDAIIHYCNENGFTLDYINIDKENNIVGYMINDKVYIVKDYNESLGVSVHLIPVVEEL